LAGQGRPLVDIVPVDELLEDEDLLEMMHAGLIPATAIDTHKAALWSQVFEALNYHWDIKIRTGSHIGWAVRKQSPRLKSVVNGFIEKHRKGTRIGNVLFNRYWKSIDWIRNVFGPGDRERYDAAVRFLREYAERYGFDWTLIAALAYQESRIDQSKRSPQGAVGVMQILPSTTKDPHIAVPDIEKLEHNIHAGVKYLRFLYDRYFANEPMDGLNKGLFALASYNAGPARIARLRRKAKQAGLDPNIWFRNVEIIAARQVGRETVRYVENIRKYAAAYRLIVDHAARKDKVKENPLR